MVKPTRARRKRARPDRFTKPKKRAPKANRKLRQRPPLEWWQVPELWPDSTMVVIGGGPSISSTPLHLIHHLPCVAANNAFKLGPWVDAMFFGDCRWFEWHKEALLKYEGIKTTTCERHRGKMGIKLLKRENSEPLAKSSDSLAWNKSSGAAAINLAVHLGARRIILVGFDMQQVDGQSNYHNEHKTRSGEKVYRRFKSRMPQLAKALQERGISAINATPGSALNAFPIMALEEALAHFE